jgi:hypothetical protein
MNDLDLEALSKLETEATPGPWESTTDREPRVAPLDSDLSRQVRTVAANLSAHFGHRVLIPHGLVHHTDAEFLVALRNAAPALLEKARRLEELESAIEWNHRGTTLTIDGYLRRARELGWSPKGQGE